MFQTDYSYECLLLIIICENHRDQREKEMISVLEYF